MNEIDGRQPITQVSDEKANSLLQNDRSNTVSSDNNQKQLSGFRQPQNHNNCDGESLYYTSRCGGKPNHRIHIIITGCSVIVAVAAVSITIWLYIHKHISNYSDLTESCFRLCQPNDINKGIRERIRVKLWIPEEQTSVGSDSKRCPLELVQNGIEKEYSLFAYPTDEPVFDPAEVGEELMLSPLIQAGRLEEVRIRSEVKGLPGTDILSYSGFITVDNLWKSHLFFWFFPAYSENNQSEKEGLYANNQTNYVCNFHLTKRD